MWWDRGGVTAGWDCDSDCYVDSTADRDSTATIASAGNRTVNRDSTSTATIASTPTRRPRQHSPAPHPPPHPRQHRTSILPSLGDLSALPGPLPRARSSRAPICEPNRMQLGVYKKLGHFYPTHRQPVRHPFRPIPEPRQDAIWWRPTPSSVRATARACSQVGRSAVGEVWGLRENRVPNLDVIPGDD